MNLEQLIDQIADAEQQSGHQVSLEDVLSQIGRRSFGPVLLLVGLITMAPLVGLALIARDGLLALIAFVTTAATIMLVITSLL